MSVQIVGTMLDPSGGQPAGGAMIQFIALAPYAGVAKGAQSIQTTSATGEYDFPLNYGRYAVAINHSGRFVNQAVSVSVNEESPATMDLDTLFESTAPLTPPEFAYLEELLAKAEQAVVDAEGFAGDAANQVSLAEGEVVKATNQANIATIEADRSKTEADRAAEVTGLDTVEQAVDMALGEFAGLMTESEARAINRINEAKYDASGFVDMGKAYTQSSANVGINEGMWTALDNPNLLRMGSDPDLTSSGESKTIFPVLHIAGAVSNILKMSSPSANRIYSQFLLPEAEDGARIYDSTGDARGSGQASLDLKVDVDPKYGDAPSGTEAEILREAVGRAFEGHCKNGDFRLGDNGDWASDASSWGVTTSGAEAVNLTSRSLYIPASVAAGVTYKIAFVCELTSGSLTIRDSSGTVYTAVDGRNDVTITASGSGFWFGTASSVSAILTSVEIAPVTEEVVTHPVDLVGFEYYEEELTGVQEVFECIQSLSTTFGGTDVPTVLSTRKLSYFQQYDGQFPEVTADPDKINDRYRCVVWPNLTDEQKRKVAAYMGEKLFMGVNGNIVNGRLRARTIRGAGNGDWQNVDSANDTSALSYKDGWVDGSVVEPQGIRDSVQYLPTAQNAAMGYAPTARYTSDSQVSDRYLGAFSLRDALYGDARRFGGVAYQGRCFMYVVATAPRANKGIYVEGLNEYSTAKCSDDKFWYESANKPTTLAECFIGQVGGDIASGKSGHPGGIFYDGIEAGGLNGVIDWRLGAVANDSPEEAAKVEAKVENGTYRGLEKLVWTEVGDTAISGSNKILLRADGANVHVSDIDVTVPSSSSGRGSIPVNGAVYKIDGGVVTDISDRLWGTGDVYISQSDLPDTATVVIRYKTNLSVSGDFNTQMVIGDPANILQTKGLKDGWLGTWCNVIPDGTQLWFPYSLKFVGDTSSSSARRTYTVDGGVTWIEGGLTFDSTLNAYRSAADANYVGSHSYRAFANQTKPSENKRVYNGKAGLMSVFSTMANQQSTLSETLIGKVLKSSGVNLPYGATNSLTDFTIIDAGYASNESLWGKLGEIAGQFPNHTKLRLGAPINDSPAIKVLPYQISNNGKGSIGYQANELTWDATKATPDDATAADGSSFTAWVVGETYKITGGQFSGKVLQCVGSLSVVLDGYIFEGKDGLYLGSTGALRFKPYTLTTGWGDDDTIKVTAEGSDTFVDTNGIINESVVHELAIPYTWTSNHARAGTQVPGVDL
ncbi:putative methyl-accepting chemotaxis protein [Vibrio phage 168E36-1]|nr:putative methyl-accepting chemotaxis protein [Vibrio phage 168E36-1]